MDDPPQDNLTLNTNDTNSTNSNFEEPWKEKLKPILDILLLLILIIIMLALGCEVKLKNLCGHVKRPIGLGIGIVCQFGIMPLVAYAVLILAHIEGLQAIGVLIISCCPGGALSNTFTYFIDGDLPLSVAMTTTSTILGMGMLPANIWLYGRSFESINLIIPYQKMAMSVLVVISPMAVGMLLKWKLPKIAYWTSRIGTCSGLFCILAICFVEAAIFPNIFTSVPPTLYLIILSLPILGLVLGYAAGVLMRQTTAVCKTIAIECGVQNVPLALTITTLSFPFEMQRSIVLLPWLYGFAMIAGCTVLSIVYQAHKRYRNRFTNHEMVKTDTQEGIINDEKEDLMNGIEVKIRLKPVVT